MKVEWVRVEDGLPKDDGLATPVWLIRDPYPNIVRRGWRSLGRWMDMGGCTMPNVSYWAYRNEPVPDPPEEANE